MCKHVPSCTNTTDQKSMWVDRCLLIIITVIESSRCGWHQPFLFAIKNCKSERFSFIHNSLIHCWSTSMLTKTSCLSLSIIWKKVMPLLKTECNIVVGATLFLVANNIGQYCWALINLHSGVTMLNNIVDNQEQFCPNNIVASCFQQHLIFGCVCSNQHYLSFRDLFY